MHIGFTGTRTGMNEKQKRELKALLNSLVGTNAFHHGDCIGADAEFHDLVREIIANATIIIHPPSTKKYRAFKSVRSINELLPEKNYLQRNRDIVKSSDFIIAAPKEYEEVLRSGTWSTIRFAKKLNKKMLILWR